MTPELDNQETSVLSNDSIVPSIVVTDVANQNNPPGVLSSAVDSPAQEGTEDALVVVAPNA